MHALCMQVFKSLSESSPPPFPELSSRTRHTFHSMVCGCQEVSGKHASVQVYGRVSRGGTEGVVVGGEGLAVAEKYVAGML